MLRRVIVDENAGPGTVVWEQFQRAFGGDQNEYVFLSEAHVGIPDVEILDKLLGPGAVLLTNDCVLHMRAIKQGRRSYALNKHGQLTKSPRSTSARSPTTFSQRISTIRRQPLEQPVHW